jgi:ABC-type transporter Mla maintaining outer membrane lipid asymmetry ATPase subunit MlaF
VGLLSDQGEEEPLRVGMVFQNAALFDSLTVGENVGFLLYEHSSLPKAEIQRRVAESLAQVCAARERVCVAGPRDSRA